MEGDLDDYKHFTTKANLDKAINTLIGIFEGIAIDGIINDSERRFLALWIGEHEKLENCHPFNELVPLIKNAFKNNYLENEIKQDIVWVCEKIQSTEYYNLITADIQRLHGIISGIVADYNISIEELNGLALWIENHQHLKKSWPFDEIECIVKQVLKDKKIDAKEHKLLIDFFSEFNENLTERSISNPIVTIDAKMNDLFAYKPKITFKDSLFCFTGASLIYSRASLTEIVNRLGGEVSSSVNKNVDYLIIGGDGNPCWAYSCYGRKVEKAVHLIKSGSPLLIISEKDFHSLVLKNQ